MSYCSYFYYNIVVFLDSKINTVFVDNLILRLYIRIHFINCNKLRVYFVYNRVSLIQRKLFLKLKFVLLKLAVRFKYGGAILYVLPVTYLDSSARFNLKILVKSTEYNI